MAAFVEEGKRFEELLATDNLFVEYFNSFLALPTFPDALLFNKETKGFEVANDAKKRISKEIKTAIRASKRKSRIYRVSKHHSFSDITLIPMEEEPWQESKEIDTTFTVMTLNKEQGIEWIKKERLPMFLESEYYLEYRLATILTQVKLKQEHTGTYNVTKIDFTPITSDEKSAEEIAREEDERLTNQIMKECFVCMGDTPSTTTDAWMSQAKSTVKAELSTTPSTPGNITSAKPSSVARPKSASSLFDGQSRSTMDSGYESANIDLTSITSDIEAMNSKLFEGESLKPVTPRPSEAVCVINSDSSENLSKPLSTGVAYATYGHQEEEPGLEGQVATEPSEDISVETDDLPKRSVGFSGEDDIKSVSAESEMSIPYTESDQSSVLDEDLYTFKTINDLGAVIVGTVLKQSIAEIAGADVHDVSFNENVKKAYPHKRYHNYTVDMLAGAECYVLQDPTTPVPTPTPPPSDDEDDKNQSDDDSLLDSEDDFEEMDDFFRRTKIKRYRLDSKKGVDEFGKFLEGTRGERNWSFWLDVDRCRNITDAGQLQQYLTAMKEMYLRHGAPLELPHEVKVALGLTEPSSWTTEKLLSVQNNMAEPLVLYWAPRFLLNQKCKIKPEKNELYKHQKLISGKDKPQGPGAYPNPPTATMLPLRPKTCVPRMTRSAPSEKSLEITDAFEPSTDSSVYYNSQCEITTSSIPPIGIKKRIYNFSAYPKQAVHNLTKLKNMEKQESTPVIKQKLPKELITPKLDVSLQTRPSSARSSTDNTKVMPKKPRAQSALSKTSSVVSSMTAPIPPKEPSPNRPISGRSSRPTSRLSGRSVAEPHDDLISMTSTAQPTSVTALEDGIEKAKRDKRGSASTIQSEISEFFGGRRLEGLLQALSSEKLAGNFIKKYIENTGNKLWLNCMNFWTELQEYHKLFYAETIDPFNLKKKAQHIHSQYVVRPSPFNIGCGKEISDIITSQLDPPYEELFDLAEEYCFNILFEAWSQMLTCDLTTYEKIELIEVKRHLETKNKYVTSLQRRGLIKRSVTPEEPMEGYEDPVYDEALLEKIPEEFREYNLEKLVHNRIELEHFRVFLTENYASMDLMCWMDVEAFRRIPHTDEKRRNMKAKDIRVKYMTKKYFFGPNSPAGKEGQEKVMEAGGGWGKLLEDRPPTQCLLEMQKYVRDRLEKKWLPMFLATDGFAERMHERASMSDAAEDILLQRRKRSQAVWKMMESKWITSSKDIITFRKALMNPITSLQFRRFASIKGDTLENDVLFWQEVQKYKEMYHTHCDEHLVNQKVIAIITCFLDSQIPPSLQIDIPPEMAEKILERRREMGPYVFREAQLTVFRVLFTHWNDFCNFRSNLADEKILPTIERQRRRARLKEKALQKKLEEKAERDAARRKALGITIDGEEAEHDPYAALNKFDKEDDDDANSQKEEPGKLSFQYSSYINALDQEEIMNKTDALTFSSTSDNGSVKDNTEEIEVDDETKKAKTKEADKKDVEKDANHEKRKKKEKKKVRMAESPTVATEAKPTTSDSHSQTDKHQINKEKDVSPHVPKEKTDTHIKKTQEDLQKNKTVAREGPRRKMPPLGRKVVN